MTDDLQPIPRRNLLVRTLTPEERPRAAQLLDQEHPLGADRPVGHTLTQGVHDQGRWLALLAGRQHLAEIHRLDRFLSPKQRARLGWPFKPGTGFQPTGRSARRKPKPPRRRSAGLGPA